MKKRIFLGLSVFSIMIFGSCNKDDEVIIDTPSEDFGTESFSVIEYLPAPGQFIGDPASGFEDFSTMEEACTYAQRRIQSGEALSLGAWGGYVTVKAQKSIRNTGTYDFSIAGNAFDTSNEPGIVWVMQDKNGNGIPDEEWYELRGSYYGKEGFELGYEVTYYRPEAKSDVRWTDNRGNTGTIKYVGIFHSQEYYYPSWVTADSYTLKGTRLPQQVVYDEATGNWSNLPFEWGYVDNRGSDSEYVYVVGLGRTLQMNYFRISDAVDADGKPVSLDAVDFIKVQTGVMGESGRLGENSTEVCGFFPENQ